jgi:hypothetical protein
LQQDLKVLLHLLISFWQGILELTPASDTWVDTVRLEAKIINVEGNYAETLANAVNFKCRSTNRICTNCLEFLG